MEKKAMQTVQFIIVFSLLLLLKPVSVSAQINKKELANNNISKLHKQNILMATSQSLQTIVELNNPPYTLGKAIKSIASQAGLKPSYSKQFVPVHKKVEVLRSKVTAEKALQAVLSGTSLSFKVSPSGQLVLLEKPISATKITLIGISGRVTEAGTGEIMPGVNILVKGTQNGTSTNAKGNYKLSVESLQDTLVFTFIGYRTKTVPIKGRTKINVALKPTSIGLNRMVVTGYTQVRKSELTSSISSVSSDEIEDVPMQNAQEVLQGRAAGVRVTNSSGTPGAGFSVRVRGRGSINASSRPLYIVDGVQISTYNQNGLNPSTPLNAIPPSEIKSIEVLKDAAATAIYGSQGANGVVLINTKQASSKTQVSASYTRGAVTRINSVKTLNRDQFIEYFEAAYQHDTPGLTSQQAEQKFRDTFLPKFGFDKSTPFNELPNTNWLDYNTRTGISQKYEMSFSGGDEANSYHVSGLYDDQEGYIRGNKYDNYAFHGNFNQNVSPKLTVKEDFKISEQKIVGPCQDGFYINCPISQALISLPLAEAYHTVDGKKVLSHDFPEVHGFANNPEVQLKHRTRQSNTLQLIGSLSGTYDFTPHVSLKTQFSMDYRNAKDKDHRDNIIEPSEGGRLTRNSRYNTNFQNSTTLNLDYALNERNSLSGILGFDYRRNAEDRIYARGIGFPNQQFSVLSTAATPTRVGGYNREFRRVGYFMQGRYNYNQTYFLKVSGRYGGSSRFGANHRFGFFPSAAAAWNIANESFFNVSAVNELKLRASYGVSGNSNIGYFPALSLYEAGGSYRGTTGLSPSQLANSDLTWEKAKQIDLALDLGLFDGRVTASVDVYRKKNTNLLLDEPLPNDSGFDGITRNVGAVRNQGYEIQLTTANIRAKDFQWRTNFNLTYTENKVLSLVGGEAALSSGSTQPVQVGHSIDAWKVTRWAGVNPADGRPMWYDKDGNLTYHPHTEDHKFVGHSGVNYYGGLGNAFNYKGFSLNIFFSFQFGQLARPYVILSRGIYGVGHHESAGIVQRLHQAWRKPGDISQYPAPSISYEYPGTRSYSYLSSNELYSSDYIRLKTLRFGYTLPTSFTQKFNVNTLQFFIAGNNLYTWTSYIGFDPEIAGDQTRASIPVGRVINGGVRVRF